MEEGRGAELMRRWRRRKRCCDDDVRGQDVIPILQILHNDTSSSGCCCCWIHRRRRRRSHPACSRGPPDAHGRAGGQVASCRCGCCCSFDGPLFPDLVPAPIHTSSSTTQIWFWFGPESGTESGSGTATRTEPGPGSGPGSRPNPGSGPGSGPDPGSGSGPDPLSPLPHATSMLDVYAGISTL